MNSHLHHLQYHQCPCLVVFKDGTSDVLILDLSTGHWLDPRNNLAEVGYWDRAVPHDKHAEQVIVHYKAFLSGRGFVEKHQQVNSRSASRSKE